MAKKRRPFGLRLSWLPVKFFNPPSIKPAAAISKPKPTKRTKPPAPSPHLIDIQSHATSQPASPSPSPFGEANQTQPQLQNASQSQLISLTSQPSSPSSHGGSTQQSPLGNSTVAAAGGGDQSPSSHLASDQPPYSLLTMSKPSSPSGGPSQYHHHMQISSSDSNPASPQTAHHSPSGHSSPPGGPGQYHHMHASTSDSNPASPQTPHQSPPHKTSPPATPQLSQQSPSHAATQLQLTAAATVSDQPQFPREKLESAKEETPQPLPNAATHQFQSTAVEAAVSREKPKPQVFRASPQKPPQLSTSITSANFSGEPIIAKSSSQTDDHRLETQPLHISGPNAKASSATTAQIMPASESQEESGETEERKEAIPRELKPEENINGLVHGDPKQAAASGQKTHDKDHYTDGFHAEQQRERQDEKQEALEIKEALTSSHFHGSKIEPVVLTHRKVEETVSGIHQKANIYNGDQNPLHKEIQEIISMFVLKLPDQALLNGKPLSAITLNGENEGAFMQLASEPVKKENPVHIHRDYKISTNESFKTSTNIEESFMTKSPPKEDHATKAYINSNAQSVNNSMLSNHRVTERNPGVHLASSQNATRKQKVQW